MLFPSNTQFYGDATRWWYGVVQEVASDPLELGRARVRIAGIHGPDIEDQHLPWASVVLPTTSGGVSGVGTTPWLQPTARVMGIFLDGTNSQLPVILGAIPAFEGDISQAEGRGTTGGLTGIDPRTGEAMYAGTGNSGNSHTANTNFSGTDVGAQAAIASVFRELSPMEFSNLTSLVFAESGPHQVEQAWVAGVVINRARKRGQTITQVLNAKCQFSTVTGQNCRGGPNSNFRNGPPESRRKSIYGSITNHIKKVPRNVYYFDANGNGAWTNEGGTARKDKTARNRQKAGGTLKLIGATRFWPGARY